MLARWLPRGSFVLCYMRFRDVRKLVIADSVRFVSTTLNDYVAGLLVMVTVD